LYKASIAEENELDRLRPSIAEENELDRLRLPSDFTPSTLRFSTSP
jgi:hypothetical protein